MKSQLLWWWLGQVGFVYIWIMEKGDFLFCVGATTLDRGTHTYYDYTRRFVYD